VNGGTNAVVRLDTVTGQYESYDVQMYAHSLDLDPQGNIWVNDYFAKEERVARVSAATGEVTILPIPAANRPKSEGVPLPYGLQVDRKGRLYSTQLAANTLAVYDTVSGAGELVEMPHPNSGPRRPGLGPDGRLWIPEFNTGFLTAFDPDTGDFKRIDLGLSTLGAYDVEVDQKTGEVWISGSLDSSMLRYNPESGAIDRIPLPTEPAYTRHIAIDPKNGDVWTAYSSLPAAQPKVVRLRFGDKP
jgi:virginiamycin B lyase